MKLGIGLPNTLAHELDRALLLDWARLADEAGFYALGTIDKPNYDSWDPLMTLAAVAGVTERSLLATTILQLANRNEVIIAKQAAVLDRVSEGRLLLCVAMGGRRDDFEVCGVPVEGRTARFGRQIPRMREIWANAQGSDWEHGVLGPAPIQNPLPVVVGAQSERGLKRAIDLGDGFLFGTAGSQMMSQMTPMIRQMAAAEGKHDFTIGGLAYVGVGDNPAEALDEAAHHVLRYYGQLWMPAEQLIHHGPTEVIAEAVKAYEAAGLDYLLLIPEIPSLSQVEKLAEGVLPAYL
ncbi:MAG: LLM class flavin-dependent oxidoreductase [Actinomycetota bacterium]